MNSAVISPDGRWIIAPLTAPGGRASTLAVEPVRGGAPFRIALGDSLSLNSMAVSPNARWIGASLRDASGVFNLWALPLHGGAPIRLTSGPFREGGVQWFPSGDRILFLSDRIPRPGGGAGPSAMILPFDNSTGRAAGPMAPLAMESFRIGAPGLRLSPDGRWIAYVPEGKNQIKILPVSGGEARVIAEPDDLPSAMTWSADSKSIVFTRTDRDARREVILQAPVSGGAPEEVYRAANFGGLVPGGQYMLLWEADPASPMRVVNVADFRGRVVTRHRVGWNVAPASVTVSPDGRHLVGIERISATALRLRRMGGDSSRTLSAASDAQDWPIGWAADGGTTVVGRKVSGYLYSILLVPVDGGEPRIITLPPGAGWRVGVAGHYASYTVNVPGTEEVKTIAVDLKSADTAELFGRSAYFGSTTISGAGGTFGVSGRDFLTGSVNGDRLEIRASAPGSRDRLVRSLPLSQRRSTLFAVHGNRLAYCEMIGDSAALMVTDGPAAAPRRVATLPSHPARCLVTISWSHGGRQIATHHGESEVLVVDAEPRRRANPRVLKTGMRSWSDAVWLPDDSGFTIAGRDGNGSHVLLVSLRPGAAPVNLTSGDPGGKVIHSVSPDGRYIAYGAMIPIPASIVILESADPRGRARR